MSEQDWNPADYRPSPETPAGRKTVEELAREFEDVVVQRLSRVEASNRRLRATVLGFVVLNLLLALGGAAIIYTMTRGGRPAWAAHTVTARRFALADAAGNVRGYWGVDQDGANRFVLSDSAGHERMSFSVLSDGGSPGLSLSDESGTARVALAYLPDETSTLVFADRAGVARAVFGVSAQSATVLFADRQGNTKAGLGVDQLGQPNLVLSEEDAGTPVDTVAADTTGG